MIYVTDGSFEGILTAVFEAYVNKEEPESIVSKEFFQMQLGSEVREIKTDSERSHRVNNAIKSKVSQDALEIIYRAWLSEHNDVGVAIYKYIKLGLQIGSRVVSFLQNPDILMVNDLSQKVFQEYHLFLGILRFKKLKNGIYYSKIEPDNNIIMLLTVHFAERMADQPWIIHDARRNISALYNTEEVVYTMQKEIRISEDICEDSVFETLWKNYFQSIAIESRKNLRLQRSFMPRRYWKNLPEKQL
ncbi:MAG: TIGR03915 family putative DNA repair protein [Acetivibrionales bacterium]|jgi:probable DNA metabolism protein|nr:DNA metabolism protein [Clostridiaceae bacterium]